MKVKIVCIILLIISLVSCSSDKESGQMQQDLIGTWVATEEDEPLDTYEFHADGTGLMRDSSEAHTYYKPVLFVYEFIDSNTIEFSAEEGHSIKIDISMPSVNQVAYDAQVTGGYHIDFERVGSCPYDTLAECIVGRWVRYWPNEEFTFNDFYVTEQGAIFVPEFEETTHFSYHVIGDDSIEYQVEGAEPIEVKVTLPDNYKMIFEMADGEEETITYYRLDAPFGPQ